MEDKRENDSRWSKASFCIYGDSLQPDEISRDLGLRATISGLKGERQSRFPKAKLLRTSLWTLDSPLDEHSPLQDHLAWLLQELEPKLKIVSEIAKQYDTRLFCGYSSEHGQGGCAFEAALLDRLAALGVPLVLDLYPPGPITIDSIQGE